MNVRDLIAELQEYPDDAIVYVKITDPETDMPVLAAVASIDPAASASYGDAAIIEMEESA